MSALSLQAPRQHQVRPVNPDDVGATASAVSVPDEHEVLVTIKVDDKFHINANPASFDFQIPTTVEFKDIKPNKVDYPKPAAFDAFDFGGRRRQMNRTRCCL